MNDMTTRRRIGAVLMATAAVPAVIVATLTFQGDQGGNGPRVEGTDPVILVGDASDPDSDDAASYREQLVYLESDRCLMLGRPRSRAAEADNPVDSTQLLSVIWPEGTTPVKEGDRAGVNIPGRGIAWAGDVIEAAGGSFAPHDIPGFPEDLPAACVGNGVTMLNTVDSVSHSQ